MGGRTSAASHNKYNAKAYDRINLVVRKGQKEQIQEYAKEKGMSLNAYINALIQADAPECSRKTPCQTPRGWLKIRKGTLTQ